MKSEAQKRAQKKYMEAHPEKCIENNKRWRQTHKEEYNLYYRNRTLYKKMFNEMIPLTDLFVN